MQKNEQSPKDWQIKKLGDIFTLSAGGDVDKSCFSENRDAEHPYPIFANALTNMGLYGYSSKYIVAEESITITGRGDIGKVFYRKGKYTPIVRLITAVPKTGISAKYMSYACAGIRFFNETTGVPQLTVPQAAWYKVPVPSLKEQEKIAEILGTWDYAIEKLIDLIAEKQTYKNALVQRILSRHCRLNGFYGVWTKKEFSEILDYEQPVAYLVDEVLEYDATKTPVLTANKAFVLGSTDDDCGIYNNGDCIIFDDFTTDSKYVTFRFKVKSSAIKILTPKSDQINLRFVYEQMKRIKYPIGGHKRYYLSEFQYLTILIPEYSEQCAIANVLMTADAEIDLLNQQLNVLKEQKQGLMQQLLTGKIRVSTKEDKQKNKRGLK